VLLEVSLAALARNDAQIAKAEGVGMSDTVFKKFLAQCVCGVSA
jgi:hypothetical protein